MTPQIAIMGLGWLGLPLYTKLSSLGYVCVGSTTSEEKKEFLQKEGVKAVVAKFEEGGVVGNIQSCLKGSKILILNTPPGLRKDPKSNYVAKIEKVINYIEKSDIEKVLYISSTSVFEDKEDFPEISNKTIPNATSKAGLQIREVERLLLNNTNFKTTILRFSGLVDNDRHPANMMSKRLKVGNPMAPVNLIHRKDCIGIISTIIKQSFWGDIFNASYPSNLTKKEYYDGVCTNLGLLKPNFDKFIKSKGKLIDGLETSKTLNYTYKYVV